VKPSSLLTASAIYLALIGILLQVDPIASVGLDANASAVLITNIRVPLSLLLAIAVINWFARKSDASSARDAIFLGNTVAFAFVAIGDFVASVMSGGDSSSLVFSGIALLFAIAFFVVGRANMSTVTK
jgi:Na+/H+ antiporter NhaC